MTTTDVAGVPAELRAQLARARVAQEVACAAVGVPKTTYYRAMEQPASFRLGQLAALARAAGCDLRVEFIPRSLEALVRAALEDTQEEDVAREVHGS